MAADPVLTAVISIGTSVITTVIALALKESFETQTKISRMMVGLCLDCSGTVKAFEKYVASLKAKFPSDYSPENSLNIDLALLQSLPSGFIVSPPLTFPKELVNLLPSEHSRSIFQYYDSWDRYDKLESRYRELFLAILKDLSSASSNDPAKTGYDFVRKERLEQLKGLTDDLYQTIHRLMSHSCAILVHSPSYLDHASKESVDKLTSGRWKSWQAIRDSRTLFQKECGAECE